MKTDKKLLERKPFFLQALSAFAVIVLAGAVWSSFPSSARADECTGVTVPEDQACDPDVKCSTAWKEAAAHNAYVTKQIVGMTMGWENAQRHDIRSSQCIDLIINGFSSLNLGSILQTFIANFLNNLASQACAAGSSYINAALSELCIPMPDLSFNLDINLSKAKSKSCDGLSLTDFIKARSGNPLQLPTGIPPYTSTLWYRWGPKLN